MNTVDLPELTRRGFIIGAASVVVAAKAPPIYVPKRHVLLNNRPLVYAGPVVETATTEYIDPTGMGHDRGLTFLYQQTLAIMLCEDEIDSVTRIWENGELTYDANTWQGDLPFVLYRGLDKQEPDPTIAEEAFECLTAPSDFPHAGPGFSGLAYLVFPKRELLEAQGRRPPRFAVEIAL